MQAWGLSHGYGPALEISMPTLIACCRPHPHELVIHPTPGDSSHNIWEHMELGRRLPGHCRGIPGPPKDMNLVLFPNLMCCLLLPLLMQWPNFSTKCHHVCGHTIKGHSWELELYLKRDFFNGKYFMSPENSCLSPFCRSWFRRHWYTSQWTGFHQLCKFPCHLPMLGLACFLICRSHRWKQQEGLFSTSLTGSKRAAQSCVGLAVIPLSKHASWHRSGVGGSDTGILSHCLTWPRNLGFLSCCFIEMWKCQSSAMLRSCVNSLT